MVVFWVLVVLGGVMGCQGGFHVKIEVCCYLLENASRITQTRFKL